MNLKYFNINDNKETLKKKWKKLALIHHPDRNRGNEEVSTKKMQEINTELAYCIKFGGEFDINKFDMKNPHDLKELMKIFMSEIIDDAIKSESNRSVLEFYKRAKNIVEHGISPHLIIRVNPEKD